MNAKPRLSATAREAAFDGLLRDHPDARVVAIARNALFVPMPPHVCLRGQAVIEGASSMLDVVDPGQGPLVISAWDRMFEEGDAEVTVRAAGGTAMSLSFFDLRDRYGVIMGVMLGYRGTTRAPEDLVFLPRSSVMRKDEVSVILAVDEATSGILGWSPVELVGQRSLDLIHPEDRARAIGSWMRMLVRPGSSNRIRLRHRHRDGAWLWLEVTNHNHLDDPDEPHVLADMVDVTTEVEAIDTLRTNARMLRRLTEALPVGVLYIEADRTVSYVNDRLAAMTGIRAEKRLDEQLDAVPVADRVAALAAVEAALERTADADLEVSFWGPAGTRRCLVSLRPVTNDADKVTGVITCLVDITADANHREHLEHRVRYDPLTDCLNHPSIMDELQRCLEEPRDGQWTAALFIDLDEFKETNDRYGHAHGDRLLKHVAAQLRQAAGDDGLVGRVGGDEFLVVMRTAANPRALTGVAARVAAALDSPIPVPGGVATPKCSIGLAYADGLGAPILAAADLVAAADAAMYQSKRLGDGTPIIDRHESPAGPYSGIL